MMSQQGSAGNVIAAIASFFIPGLGQLVQGRIMSAIIFFVITAIGYATMWLIIPGIIAVVAHLWAIIDAAKFQSEL